MPLGAVRPLHMKFRFTVEVDNLTSAGFQKCSELAKEVTVAEYHEGGASLPSKVPARVKVNPVTLTRGTGLDLELYDWFKQVFGVVENGGLVQEDYKRNLDIVQRDNAGNEVRRWEVLGAWPSKFKAGDWDNESDDVNIEEVELQIDDFKIVE